jgi:hypothetical protein
MYAYANQWPNELFDVQPIQYSLEIHDSKVLPIIDEQKSDGSLRQGGRKIKVHNHIPA